MLVKTNFWNKMFRFINIYKNVKRMEEEDLIVQKSIFKLNMIFYNSFLQDFF